METDGVRCQKGDIIFLKRTAKWIQGWPKNADTASFYEEVWLWVEIAGMQQATDKHTDEPLV